MRSEGWLLSEARRQAASRITRQRFAPPKPNELLAVTRTERADAFVALPGGIGTFEELYEVWTWRHLGYHDQPIGLLNAAGFYDGLLAFMRYTVSEGFLSSAQLEALRAGENVGPLLDELEALARQAAGPEDFRRI